MLTARERERCRELAAALDAGDRAGVYRRAESAGFSGEERGEIWDRRQHVIARAAQAGARNLLPMGNIPKNEAQARDLDYWSDEPDAEPDDDDPMPVCGACDGTGKDGAGNQCKICGGTGRIPAEDQEDDDDHEDDE